MITVIETEYEFREKLTNDESLTSPCAEGLITTCDALAKCPDLEISQISERLKELFRTGADKTDPAVVDEYWKLKGQLAASPVAGQAVIGLYVQVLAEHGLTLAHRAVQDIWNWLDGGTKAPGRWP